MTRAMAKSAICIMAVVAAFILSCCGMGSTLGPATLEDQQSRVEAATTTPRLQPGEKIRILVFGESSLTGDYEIDQSGFVSLPLAGTFKAAGSTQPELEKELAKRFRSQYLRDPKVTVTLVSLRPFYIVGEVEKPGEYQYKSGLNVLTALALAGGTTYRGSRSTVYIQRVGETGMREYPLSSAVMILPGDLIKVPERYF
jgi:protein involved in polysaccharide export with SLBB domain